jgi:hypothetical protein
LVQYVGEVLGRAHSLFGDPPESGGAAAGSAGNALGGAGQLVRGGQQRVSALSGDFVSAYSGLTGMAAPALDTLAGLGDHLGATLSDAAGADRSGRSQSGAVLNGAFTDTTALAPWTGTPAGQKALLTRLRGRAGFPAAAPAGLPGPRCGHGRVGAVDGLLCPDRRWWNAV